MMGAIRQNEKSSVHTGMAHLFVKTDTLMFHTVLFLSFGKCQKSTLDIDKLKAEVSELIRVLEKQKKYLLI